MRGDLKDLNLVSGDATHDKLVSDLEEINGLTGLCVYFSGIRASSCPGQAAESRVGSVRKAVYEGDAQSAVTLTVSKQGIQKD